MVRWRWSSPCSLGSEKGGYESAAVEARGMDGWLCEFDSLSWLLRYFFLCVPYDSRKS